MAYIEVALLVAGVAGLAVGYRRNHRNLMLTAAIVLFLGGAVGDFARGLVDGWNAGAASAPTATVR